MDNNKILNYANTGELALMLCILGGKTEKENERIFPNIDQSLSYLSGLTPLKGRVHFVNNDAETHTPATIINKVQEQQLSLFA